MDDDADEQLLPEDAPASAEFTTAWRATVFITTLLAIILTGLMVGSYIYTTNISNRETWRYTIQKDNITALDTDIGTVNETACNKSMATNERIDVLDERVTPLEERTNTLETLVDGTRTNVTTLQMDVAQTQTDIVNIESDIGILQNKDMQLMDTDAAQQVQIDMLLSSGMMLVNGSVSLNETLLQLLMDVDMNKLDIDTLQTDVANKVMSVTAGTGIDVTGPATMPVVSLDASISDLDDVDTTGVTTGDVLVWSGTQWIPMPYFVPPNTITLGIDGFDLFETIGTPTPFAAGWSTMGPVVGTEVTVPGGVPTVMTTGVYDVRLRIEMDRMPSGPFGFTASVECTSFPTCAGTFNGPAAVASTDNLVFATPAYATDHGNILHGHETVSMAAGDTLQVAIYTGFSGTSPDYKMRLTLQRIG